MPVRRIALALCLGLATSVLLPFPAIATQVSVGSGLDYGQVDVSGNTRHDTPKGVTVKHGTGKDSTAYVDPTEGMTCLEIINQGLKNTCGYYVLGDPCPESINGFMDFETRCLYTAVKADDPALAAANPAQRARTYAQDYFKSLPLPVPQPTMSAVEGTTGAVHQLDLRIPDQVRFQDPDTPFGTLSITCYGTFDVNWGDGTHDRYTVTGAPYPNSAITHSWSQRGTYVITAAGHWSADWTFGAYSGTLTGLVTNGTLPAFAVGDLQAVITR